MSYTAAQLNTIYQNVLFRPVDPSGVAAFANSSTPDAQVRQQIETSPEATQNVDPIVRLYQAELGRVPDSAGLGNFVHAYEGGTTLLSIAQQLIGSQEAATSGNSAGTTATAAFVTSVYQHILNRTPSAAEVNAQLATGASAAQLLVNIANSQEAQNTELAPTLTFLDSLAVSQPNTGSLNSQTTPGGGNAGGTGSTFTLTTGVDNLTGTTGNDTFNGTIGGANPTFNAGDQINGNGGVDTLAIVDTAGNTALPGATTVNGISTVNFLSAGGVSNGAGGAQDFSKFAGLATLNVTGTGAVLVNAASTTAENTNVTAVAGNAVTLTGGAAVAATLLGETTGAITIGGAGAAAPTGAITLNVGGLARTGATTQGAIAVTGGTSVLINDGLASTAGNGNTVTGGNITVTGTAATTTVSVAQTAAATAAAATSAQVGSVSNAGGTTAAPGVNAVPATTAVTAQSASPAVAGVIDGSVTITDANSTSGTLANTISTVSLTNFNGATIATNALSTLSLVGGAGTATITNAATSPTNKTLALNLTSVGQATATATATGATVAAAAVGLTDTNNEISTLNVTTAGSSSFLTITDTGLKTLNVTGSSILQVQTVPTSVTTIAISGAAGFNDQGTTAGDAALTSFTTSSTGQVTATLGANQSFVSSSSGQDIITITAAPTKAITAGSGVSDEIVFNADTSTFTAAQKANITGFEIFGTGTASVGPYDLSTFGNNFSTIDVTGQTAAGLVFTKAVTNASLSIDVSDNQAVSLSYADTNGLNDTTQLTLNKAGAFGAAASVTDLAVTLTDANGVGVGTVNVIANGSDIGVAGGAVDTITTFNDNNLSALNVSGSAGFTITNLTEAATSLTLNAMDTGQNGLTITNFTDNTLGNLKFIGTAAETITNFADTAANITISNTGTGNATIGTFTDANLTNLTLSGNVALGANSNVASAAIGATTGVTVSAGTDNAHINLALTGAGAAGVTDTITVGNGNDLVSDASTFGTVNITVGTGSNLITAGGSANGPGATANTSGVFNVTLGSHAGTAAGVGIDVVNVTNAGTNFATTPQTTIAGTATNDQLHFNADGAATISVNTTAVANQGTTLAQAIAAVEQAAQTQAGAGGHGAAYTVFNGNTLVAEHAGISTAAFSASADSLVQLTGVHKIGALAGTAGSIAITG